MVGFGLQLVTEPEAAKGIWRSIKSMTPDKVKTMLLGAAQDKIAKYTDGGNIMKHEAGKDGVQIAMFVVGAVKGITANASKITELADNVDELAKLSDEVVEAAVDKIDDAANKTFNRALKQGDLTAVDAEELVEEIKDSATKVDKDWMENLIKGKKYEKNIENKYIKTLDDDYYAKAAEGFGIPKEELKAMTRVE